MRCETLEDRRVLATFFVTNLDDGPVSGPGDLPGSLRQAIFDANAAPTVDSITPVPLVAGGTVLLTEGQLTLSDELTINQMTIDAGGSSRIFDITATAGDFSFNHLTLTGGVTTGDNVSPATTHSGGAIRSLTTGTLTLENTTITDNRTEGVRALGGGIFATGDVVLRDSTVSDNETTNTFGHGGGIRTSGNVALTRSTLSGNRVAGASAQGGGISNSGHLTLTESTLTGNQATGSNGEGGGISTGGDVTVTRSTVSGNSTSGGGSSDGGGIYALGVVTIDQSTVSGNRTTGSGSDGGAIRSLSNVIVMGSTISGNSTLSSSAEGGGIRASGTISISHSTIVDNEATNATGGAIHSSSDVTISHSILAGNTAFSNPDVHSGNALTVEFSLIGDNAGTTLIEAQTPDTSGNLIGSAAGAGVIDALLGPLLDNGGLTDTHAPLAGSPALDAGDPGVVGATSGDQRQAPFIRIAGAAIDMGAVERQTVAGLALVVNTDVDARNGFTLPALSGLSLREAIGLANGSVGPDVISFAAFLEGRTLTMTMGEFSVRDDLHLNGPGASLLTLDANGASRIFNLDEGDDAVDRQVTIEGLTLTGGFRPGESGTGGAILSREDLTVVDSILSANEAGGGGAIDQVGGSLAVSGSDISGNTATFFGRGGGIRFLGTNLSVVNSTIINNTAATAGGGVYARPSGTVEINDSTISGNLAQTQGGGGMTLLPDSATTTIERSTIDDNEAPNGRGGGLEVRPYDVSATSIIDSVIADNSAGLFGGGVYTIAYQHAVSISDTTIQGNSADAGGGLFRSGILTSPSGFLVTDAVISGNQAAGNGGGIFGGATINRSTIDGNSAKVGGGLHARQDATIQDSTFTNNVADGPTLGTTLESSGAGIYVRGANATITNTTISGNTATDHAGGVLGFYASIDVRHSTIVNNRADADDDGFGSGAGAFGHDITLDHTIVGNNLVGTHSPMPLDTARLITGSPFPTSFSLVGVPDTDSVADNGNNLIGSPASPLDPLLGPLRDNSGTTMSHMPLVGSPVIDAGNVVFTTPPSHDQRGAPFARVEGTIDIGSIERQTLPMSFVVDTTDDVVDQDFSAGNFSLREAIGLANGSAGNEVITFDPSLASSTILLDHGEMQILEGVTLIGLGEDHLTIDAQGNSRIFNIDDADSSSRIEVTISGLTLSGGSAAAMGGAVFANGENLTIDASTFTGSTASSAGGAVGVVGGEAHITGSTFSGNSSGSVGGAVYAESLMLVDSTLTGNSSARGGAISGASAVTVLGSSLSDNSAAGQGGALSIIGDLRQPLMIEDSVIAHNTSAGHGGGIDAGFATPVTITRTVVSGNSALPAGGTSNGGGLFVQYPPGDMTISESEFSGNSAADHGGGVYLRAANAAIVNSTISGNVIGGLGGGVAAMAGTSVDIKHSTVADNRTYSGTGGTGVHVEPGSTVTLDHAIVANNAHTTGQPLLLLTRDVVGTVNADFSLILATSAAVINGANNVLGVSPQLGPLSENGGPTRTHELYGNSPGIDAGDPSIVAPPASDQRGNRFGRVYGAAIDIGAFESQLLDMTVDSLTDGASGRSRGGAPLTLREAIDFANANPGRDTIDFAYGGTLMLTQGELRITDALTIDGPGAGNLSIDANSNSRIFNIDDLDGGTSHTVQLNGMTLTGGSAVGDGGAIFSRESLALDSTAVVGNQATDAGGGVFVSVSGGSFTVTDSSLSHNTASRAGGGLYLDTYVSSATISRSTIAGNVVMGTGFVQGGGISFNSINSPLEQLLISDSTISGNTTSGSVGSTGGGIGVHIESEASVVIQRSTIVDNQAVGNGSAVGGGIYDFNGTAALDHSIVAGNVDVSASGPDLRVNFAGVSATYSLIGDSTGALITDEGGNLIGTAGSPIDPLLGALVDNGGPTATHLPQTGSPVIDAGDSTFAAPPDFDQRGAPFVRVAGQRIDMGSVEVQVTDGDFNDDGLHNVADIDALVAEIAAGTHLPLFDLTSDGLVTLSDLDAWRALAGEINLGPGKVYLVGDANLDSFVDEQDFVAWNVNKFTDIAAWSAADFNADGRVNGRDFLLWNANKFGTSDGPSPPDGDTAPQVEEDLIDSAFAQWAATISSRPQNDVEGVALARSLAMAGASERQPRRAETRAEVGLDTIYSGWIPQLP